jgi:hypothetical protein
MRGHAGDVRPILRASTPHVSREQQDKEETRNDVHNAPKYVRMKNAGGTAGPHYWLGQHHDRLMDNRSPQQGTPGEMNELT